MNTAEHRPECRSLFPAWRPDQPSKKARLLYVDPNMETLVGFTVLLAMSGYLPLATQNPLEALDLAKSRLFNLAVLNYDLPQMNGLELACQIRRAKPGLPIVLLLSDGQSMTGDISAVVDQRLPRDANLHRLLSRINRWLEHRYLAAFSKA